MIKDLVAGIDSSTQSCTIILRELTTGRLVAQARAPHPPTTPPCSEQNPEDWWNAFKVAMQELKSYWGRIAAISVGGQGHGLVMLDKYDKPLRPAKLWNDTESAPDAKALCEMYSVKNWVELTGSAPGPALTIAKLLWTERNYPDLLKQSDKIMLPFDYIVYRLSGCFVTERGGSSGTGYFNPFNNTWILELLEFVNPNIEWLKRLPNIISSSAIAGYVSPLAGFPELVGAVVGAGSGDNMTAALGMNIQEGDVAMSIGTSGTIYGVTGNEIKDFDGEINGYAEAGERFLPMVTTLNAAKVTDTFRRILRVNTDEFDQMVLSCPSGAQGITLIPYLDGERTPNLPFSTGKIVGLKTTTTAEHIARAAVEGVLCGLLSGLDKLKKLGLSDYGRMIITGGGAKSKAYTQILADLTNKPVWVSTVQETAASGAAVQAAAALLNQSTEQMANEWSVPMQLVAEPSSNASHVLRTYQDVIQRYDEVL